MNKLILYCCSIIFITGCLLTKKEKVEPLQNTFISNKSQRILGDTSTSIWIPNCKYVVEDISKKIKFPDSLISKAFSQKPEIGDTIKGEHNFKISLFFEDENKIDTFFYKVNLSCGGSLVPIFVQGHYEGSSNSWEIPFLKDYPNNVVKVFNRWGNLVFEEKGYYSGWEGITNIRNDSTVIISGEKILPEGTYYYIIDLGDSTYEPIIGYIQIKR